jgi:uncharacterized protein GlcG (DUF336 family)
MHRDGDPGALANARTTDGEGGNDVQDRTLDAANDGEEMRDDRDMTGIMHNNESVGAAGVGLSGPWVNEDGTVAQPIDAADYVPEGLNVFADETHMKSAGKARTAAAAAAVTEDGKNDDDKGAKQADDKKTDEKPPAVRGGGMSTTNSGALLGGKKTTGDDKK